MPHVDEGTLHSLLDGELAPAEVLEVQTHFATCPDCAARLGEARQLLAETERLVSALEPVGQAAARPERPASPPPAGPSSPAAPSPPPRAAGPTYPGAPPTARPLIPLDPIVLIPNNPTATEVRRSRLRIMAWAATFLVVAGAGAIGLEMRQGLLSGRPAGTLKIHPEEFSSAPGVMPAQDSGAAALKAAPSAVGGTSPFAPAVPAPAPAGPAPAPNRLDKLAAPQSPPAATPDKSGRAEPQPAPPRKAAESPKLAAGPPKPAAGAPKPAAEPPKQPAAEASKRAAESAQPAAAAPGLADEKADTPSGPDERAAVAARAAEATAELDRERTRERAAAATAALDADRKAAAPRTGVSAGVLSRPAPPPVPTLDQQAQLSTRIGLDEAARQLGGPLHAIDGMTRQLVGLVSPGVVPGADTTRPVVRAVYVDRGGHTIYLDQQRVRPGQHDLPFTPQTGRNGEQRWMSGPVMLVLHGELGPDSIRALSRRVR